MKKIIIVFLFVVILAGALVPFVSASVIGVLDYNVSSTRVNLTESETGSFSITTPGADAYAAVQYQIQLPDGVGISVKYSDQKITDPLSPQNDALGYTFFSTGIATSNGLKEPLTCTVNISYSGSTIATLTVMEIKQYILNGNFIDSYVSNKTTVITLVPYSYSASTDATLSSLEIDSGTLAPAFSPNMTSYTASVENSVSSVTVTAIATNTDATVEGAGVVSLEVGENIIKVIVTAEDGKTIIEYIITITREAEEPEPEPKEPEPKEPEPKEPEPNTPSGPSRTSVTTVVAADEIEEIITPLDEPFPFTDVTQDDWFYDYVYYMWENKLMNGISDTLFNPNGAVTRGMVVTVLYRMEGEPDVDGLDNPFTDVALGQYYSNAVIWAADKGIVLGYDESTYGPNDNVTREQLAAILHRYENTLGEVPALPDDTDDETDDDAVAAPAFADEGSISGYAKPSVEALVMQGVINGKPDNKFDPKGIATRAEFAAMLYRYLEAIKTE